MTGTSAQNYEDLYKRKPRLSELIETDEQAFARRVTAQVKEHYQAYRTYRDKCKNNELFWRNRHWNETKNTENKPEPNVPLLHSTVENCVADVLDQYPDAIHRGINNDDDVKAMIVTELLRFTMQRANHAMCYEKQIRAAHKIGTGTILTFYNPEMDKGMGDVDFKYVPITDIVWDKDATSIEAGRFFAYYEYISPEDFYELYPDYDLERCFPENQDNKDNYPELNEDIRDSQKQDRIAVLCYRWKEREKRTVALEDGTTETLDSHVTYVNSVKVVGIKVVERRIKQYAHGRYMVNMQSYLQLEDEPVGLGIIDLFKDDADTVNLIQQQYLCNLQASAEDRFLINRTAGIDEKALMDYGKKLIRGNTIHEGAVRPFKPTPFTSQALNFMQGVIQRVKEQSGQLDMNIGQSSGGVTAASGIMALQEYGAKKSRLFTRRAYAHHKETIKDVFALMQEHYSTERVFRISREAQNQVNKLVEQAMQNLQAAAEQGVDMESAAMKQVLPEGVTLNGDELIVDFSIFSLDGIDFDYDIEIIPQKKNTATSNLINSMVQQGMNNGSIPPDVGLELMEFEGKDQIMRKVRERFDMTKQLEQMQQQLQQVAEQAQQASAAVEQLSNENKQLEAKYWNEKIRTIKALMRDTGGEDEESAEGTGPETADEALAQLIAEMGNRYGAA